jgi:hypothetical protein
MNAQLQSAPYTSPTEKLKAWVEGAVLHLSFNNVAKHNAISVEMWEAVPVLLDQAEKDDAIRMVVFSGQGPKRSLPVPTSRNSRTCGPRARP